MLQIDALLTRLAGTPPGTGTLLLAGLAGGLVLVLLLALRTPGRKARRPLPADAPARSGVRVGPAPSEDPQDLMAGLARVEIVGRPLLDREELRVAPFLDRAVRDLGRGHRLALQVPAALLIHPLPGSGLAERCQRITAALDQRRLTFAVLDRQARLTAAVFLGAGPDPLLAEALRLSGAPVIRLDQDWTPEQVKARLRGAFTAEAAHEDDPLLSAFTGRPKGRPPA